MYTVIAGITVANMLHDILHAILSMDTYSESDYVPNIRVLNISSARL